MSVTYTIDFKLSSQNPEEIIYLLLMNGQSNGIVYKNESDNLITFQSIQGLISQFASKGSFNLIFDYLASEISLLIYNDKNVIQGSMLLPDHPKFTRFHGLLKQQKFEDYIFIVLLLCKGLLITEIKLEKL